MKKETITPRRDKNERQLQFFSRAKSLRNATEKIVRTVRSHQPHYYQRLQ